MGVVFQGLYLVHYRLGWQGPHRPLWTPRPEVYGQDPAECPLESMSRCPKDASKADPAVSTGWDSGQGLGSSREPSSRVQKTWWPQMEELGS